MSSFILSVTQDEYKSKYSSFKEVSCLSTNEDIATFIDTFIASGIKSYNVVKALEYEGKYIFVYSEKVTWYDFFTEINKLSKVGIVISSLNAKLLFKGSRGYFDSDSYEKEVTKNIFDDDAPTGFMNEDDDLCILVHKSTNNVIPIDEDGIVIGRSAMQSDYTVANTNISRKHAKVLKRGDKMYIVDLDSANGTFVNGIKIPKGSEKEVQEGNTIKLADEIFILKRGS